MTALTGQVNEERGLCLHLMGKSVNTLQISLHYYPFRVQPLRFFRGASEVRRQDLLVVLAECWGLQGQVLGKARKLQRHPGHVKVAVQGIMHSAHGATLAMVRVMDSLGH